MLPALTPSPKVGIFDLRRDTVDLFGGQTVDLQDLLIPRAHRCQACKLEWPVPREIRWAQAEQPHELSDIEPTTSETLVVQQTFDNTGIPHIPQAVFERFTFADEENARHLLPGVRYSTSHLADCGIMTPSMDQDLHSLNDGYLHLLTLNNWYWTLFVTMATIVMMCLEIQGNIMLIAALFSDPMLVSVMEADPLGPVRTIFICTWLLSLLLCICGAFCEARLQWIMKTHAGKGDLISNCSLSSRCWTFVAMVAFEFFLLEKDVKDICILLHPWKGVQQYSAFKIETHRAFFVGFRSKTMYRVEQTRSVWHVLPIHLISRCVVFTFKVYFVCRCYEFGGKKKLSVSLLVSACTSFVSTLWDGYYLYDIYKLRRKFYKRLVCRLSRLQSFEKQHKADRRMLAQHFRCRWDEQMGKVVRMTRSEVRQGRWIQHGRFRGQVRQQTISLPCASCGRTKAIPLGGEVDETVVQKFDEETTLKDEVMRGSAHSALRRIAGPEGASDCSGSLLHPMQISRMLTGEMS